MKRQILTIALMVASIHPSTGFSCDLSHLSPKQVAKLTENTRDEVSFSVPNSTYSSSEISITMDSISLDGTTIVYNEDQRCWGIPSKETKSRISALSECILDKKVFNRDPVTGEKNAQFIIDDVNKTLVIYPTDANGDKFHGSRVSTFKLVSYGYALKSAWFSVHKNGKLVGKASISLDDDLPGCGPRTFFDSYREDIPNAWLRSGGKTILPNESAE